MIRKNQKYFNRLGVVLDIGVLIFSMLLSWWIRFSSGLMYASDAGFLQVKYYILPALLMIPVYMILYLALKLYTPKRIRAFYNEVGSIVQANIIGILIFTMILFIFEKNNYSRKLLLVFAITNTVVMILERYAVRLFIRNLRKKGYNKKHILLLGYNSLGEEFLKRIISNKDLGYRLITVLDEKEKDRSSVCNQELIKQAGGKVMSVGQSKREVWVGDLEQLEGYLEKFEVDEIFIALKITQYERLGKILEIAEKQGTRVNIIPAYYKYVPSKSNIEELDGMQIINLRYIPLDHLGNRMMKRGLDILISLLAIMIASPIMIVTALMVKFTSKGPVLYQQERIGLNKKPFMMYKFRSMKEQKAKDEKTQWTVQNDPRKTKIGTLIRKTSIDELPQFFNVLKGDMSIIGPRPERPYFVEQFKEEIPKYMIKHHVRPGITGWAQVNGWRGDTSIEKRIECDIYYIENWNVWLDMKIIFLTILNGFVNKNAY
ncbi:MAG TPA: undecaprenyl-phosphate glucose phosphotransferase [Epulopiscium sp.]|nr:undecaprenyl-phosphate glucose phosphotransferase [Candidatus Epulonipiscium sp.]